MNRDDLNKAGLLPSAHSAGRKGDQHLGQSAKNSPQVDSDQKFSTGKNVFLTGGTGFVGDLLIQNYLERTPCQLWVLSRPMSGVTAEERILDRVHRKYHHRIRIITGELGRVIDEKAGGTPFSSSLIDTNTAQQRGLYQEMTASVDEVFHNASYLGLKRTEAEKQLCTEINVNGTRRLLELMATFKRGIKAFFYTSTAFVHGRISGPEEFREDDALTNGWLNPYEESKWKAEQLVRKAGYPYRIFRPGMIARELGTDIISSHTMYGVADVLDSGYQTVRSEVSGNPIHIRVKGLPEAAHNIILRSELVDMMFDIRGSNHEMNHTYNTLNPTNTPLEDVVHAILSNLDPKMTYDFVPEIDQSQSLNHIERLLEKAVYPAYEGYLFKKSPEFSMDNIREALGDDYATNHLTRIDRRLLIRLMEDYFLTKRRN